MTTAETVSPEDMERARMQAARNEAEVLRSVANVTQVRAAAFLDVHPSTVSRQLQDLKEWCLLFAAIGLQLAPTDSMVVDQAELSALESFAFKYLEIRQQQRFKGI